MSKGSTIYQIAFISLCYLFSSSLGQARDKKGVANIGRRDSIYELLSNDTTNDMQRIQLYQALIKYYLHRGHLEEAERLQERVDSLAKDTLYVNRALNDINKGIIAEAHGLYEEAATLFDQAYRTAVNSALMEEKVEALEEKLHLLAKMDKHHTEKALTHNQYIPVVVATVLLIIVILALMRYNRKCRNTPTPPIKETPEGDSAEQQEPEGLNASLNNHELALRNLVNQLDEYLLKERNYANLKNAEDGNMIAALSTNRTYLRAAVKSVTGETLSEHIRTIQLQEARRLLQTEQNLTIEAIAMECGLSMRTFLRLFRDRYNMSPSQYRNQVKLKG
ncbi:MAG: helix-turn-helix domain-containing protein [Mediterranea sp.]|jgi:AraC-like DNA-binding protein|nr:helix-turn-helix domain-containing protein [Mediterranea sp.]